MLSFIVGIIFVRCEVEILTSLTLFRFNKINNIKQTSQLNQSSTAYLLKQLFNQELNLKYNCILDPKYYKKLHIPEQSQGEPTNKQIQLGRKLIFVHKSFSIFELVTNKRITYIKKTTDYKTKMNKLVRKLDKHLNKGWGKAGLLMERINIVDQSYLQ
ncbi:Hypothetical_protein [Hexamita inflata]|uniref:Hypothetical_protein n=1 Tax=Hexamita inflata TaxID=28002 RepID=A0AA86PXN3_9EUKA|nr:Hypothetical protein HINF_LOCUS35794 [Hexamita inflata]